MGEDTGPKAPVHRYLADLTHEERVAFALAYPFDVPGEAFVIEDGAVQPWTADIAIADRVAVIACGSNAAPQQLRRKFVDIPGPVPTLRVRLTDHVVAYAAKFSPYGSVPVTVYPDRGVAAHLFVNLLDARQLERMNETEGLGAEYEIVEIDPADVEGAGGERFSRVHTYASRAGVLAHNGRPIALADVPHEPLPEPAMGQHAVQTHVSGLLGHEGPLETFVARTIHDADERRARVRALQAHALPHPLLEETPE
jgi:hypothetical protein